MNIAREQVVVLRLSPEEAQRLHQDLSDLAETSGAITDLWLALDGELKS